MPIIITSDFPPQHGGIQRFAERLAAEYAACGSRVVVVAPETEGAAASDAALRFPVRRYSRHRSRIATLRSMVRCLREVLAQVPERHIVAMSWFPAGLAARLTVPASCITVLAHGTEIAKQRRGVRRLALRAVLRGTDVVANSRYTARLLVERGIAAPRIVNCGVDQVDRSPGSRSPTPTVLSVGRLIRRKGYDRLIEALPVVAERVRDARLVIVGDGPDRARLEELARRLGVSGSVEFTGAVSDATLERYYGEAWCFALPNRREGDDVEGFGIVFLEAAMYGLPAIGGRDSGAEDAIEDGVTGLLVDPSDVAAIANALRILLESPVRRQSMGDAGRQRAVSEFSWQRAATAILAGR